MLYPCCSVDFIVTKLKSYVDSGILGGNADRIWVSSVSRPALLADELRHLLCCMTVYFASSAL